MTKGKRFIRFVLFSALCALMLLAVSFVVQRKTVTGAWDYMNQQYGYRNEPAGSIELLAFGTSHMYCTLDPQALAERSGLCSYVLATQLQPLQATCLTIQQALKTQQPKLIVVEILMVGSLALPETAPTDAVLHDVIDPMPWSVDKIKAITTLVSPGKQKEFLLPFIAYHARWETLTSEDYQFRYLFDAHDAGRGYVLLHEAAPQTPFAEPVYPASPSGLTETSRRTLDEIRALAEGCGAKLLLLAAPYHDAAADADKLASVADYAAQKGIAFLDLNTEIDALGLDYQTDFYDAQHLNVRGAQKVADYLSGYLPTLGITADP